MGLLKHTLWGPSSRVHDSAGLYGDPRIYNFSKSPGEITGPGTTL